VALPRTIRASTRPGPCDHAANCSKRSSCCSCRTSSSRNLSRPRIEKNPLLQRDERDAAPEAEAPEEPVSSGENRQRPGEQQSRRGPNSIHRAKDVRAGRTGHPATTARDSFCNQRLLPASSGSFEGRRRGLEGTLAHQKSLGRPPWKTSWRWPAWPTPTGGSPRLLINEIDDGGYLPPPSWMRSADRLGLRPWPRVEAALGRPAGLRTHRRRRPRRCANA